MKYFKVKDREIKEEKVNQIALKSNKNDFICKYCPNCPVYITSLRGLMPFNFVYDPTCAELCFFFSEGTVCLSACASSFVLPVLLLVVSPSTFTEKLVGDDINLVFFCD